MDDRNSRLPVPLKARPPASRPSMTPTLWREAAPVVARGAALVAVSLIGEWLFRTAAKRALTPANGRRDARKSTAVVPRPADELPEGTTVVSETYFMRRIIVRR
jgi:anti-sigma factor RsiW